MHVDNLLYPSWIVPMNDDKQIVLHNHALAMQDGEIAAIIPHIEAKEQITANNIIELDGHVLMPGLINTHTHAAMNLFRGLADDLPLMDWLNNHIWPAEGQWVSEEFVHDGTQHAIAEMIRSGTTCFNDMYFFPDITADTASKAGIRASVGLIVIDFPSAWAKDSQEYFSKGIDVHDKYRHNALINTAFAPHAPYTVSDEALQKVVTFAEELDIPIHMHIHETAFEVSESEKQHGVRPLARLEKLGLLSSRLLAVHMTQLMDEEITQCTKLGVNIVHCPESNLKLASGFCPTAKLLQAGANVCIGTDSSASNNDLDMFSEMRTAAQLAKAVAEDATAFSAFDTLKAATINPAKALGLSDKIGSLKKGKTADVIAVDLNRIETQPVYDPISQLVYATGREQVNYVWVAGKCLLNDRELTTIDATPLMEKVTTWRKKIAP